MSQTLIRFLIGGAIVSAFAIIGDILKPKSFAGLFWRCPFCCIGLPGAHRVFGRRRLCRHRRPFDDGGSDSILCLCISREPHDDAIQVSGHRGHIVLCSRLVRRGRGHLLLGLGQISDANQS